MISLTSGVVITLIVYLTAPYLANNVYHEPQLEPLIKYLSISVFAQSILTVSYGVTIGYERMGLRSITQIVYSFMKSIISPILVVIGYGALGAVYGHVLPMAVTGLLGAFIVYLIYRGERQYEAPITHMEAARIIIGFGLPLFFSSLLLGVTPQIYTSLLGIHVGNEITGNWAAVLRFSALLAFVTLPINTVLLPLFSKLEEQVDELRFVYQNSIKYSAMLAYPIAFSIMAFSEQIVNVLFSGGYEQAPGFLRLYMVTFVFIGIGSNCNVPLLNSQKMTRETFQMNLIKFIISVPLAFLVIPRYGVVGLIVLQSFSLLVAHLFAVKKIHDRYGFGVDFSSSFKVLVAGIVSYFATGVVFGLLRLNPLVEIVFGTVFLFVLYLAFVILLKVLNSEDVGYLNSISSVFGRFSGIIQRFLSFYGRFVD